VKSPADSSVRLEYHRSACVQQFSSLVMSHSADDDADGGENERMQRIDMSGGFAAAYNGVVWQLCKLGAMRVLCVSGVYVCRALDSSLFNWQLTKSLCCVHVALRV
jgi:hypothetical protein